MNMQYLHPADQLVLFMQRIYDKGLTTTSGGNLSIMDGDGNIWITPAGVDKGTLTRKDMICVHPDGTSEGPHRPSSELPFHASVYRMRPDLKAVLHAHPPALMAFSIIRKVPDLDLVPSFRQVCTDARIAAYDVPGSEALGEKIGAVFADNCDVAILENHGVCIGAPDMFTAFQRFETLNFVAELQIQAGRIGKIKPLDEAARKLAVTADHQTMAEFVPGTRSSGELAARRDMITLIRRSCRMGLFTATQGTYSVRLEDGSFLITPYGLDRAYLEEEDLVLVRGNAKEAGKIPSRAVRLHALIYQNNPEIHAVLQAQPLHAMAFAVTDAVFDPRTIPESFILLRDIKKVPFASVYTDPEQTAREFSATRPALLVEDDCAIVTGGNLLQAFDRLEVMEVTAHALIDSRYLGEPVQITDDQIADIKQAFHLAD